MESLPIPLATSIQEARLILAPEATGARSWLCGRGECSHDNSFLYKIREDVDDLYKWQTFRRTSLYQSQISHADNYITLIRDVYWGFIDITRSYSSIINCGQGFYLVGKGESSRRITDRWFLNSSQWPGGLQCPYPSALSGLPQDGIFLPAFVDDHDW